MSVGFSRIGRSPAGGFVRSAAGARCVKSSSVPVGLCFYVQTNNAPRSMIVYFVDALMNITRTLTLTADFNTSNDYPSGLGYAAGYLYFYVGNFLGNPNIIKKIKASDGSISYSVTDTHWASGVGVPCGVNNDGVTDEMYIVDPTTQNTYSINKASTGAFVSAVTLSFYCSQINAHGNDLFTLSSSDGNLRICNKTTGAVTQTIATGAHYGNTLGVTGDATYIWVFMETSATTWGVLRIKRSDLTTVLLPSPITPGNQTPGMLGGCLPP